MTRVTASDKFYESSECVGDEGAEIFGTYLPRIRQNLCKSYFFDTPNEAYLCAANEFVLQNVADLFDPARYNAGSNANINASEAKYDVIIIASAI